MATVSHIIRSHYDPADREKLECETGQRTDDHCDPWQTESSFSALRRVRATPTFVPATIPYDEWGAPSHKPSSPSTVAPSDLPNQLSTQTAEWYRSLTAVSAPSSRVASPSRLPSAPNSGSQGFRPPRAQRSTPQEAVSKDTWFIRRALCSELSTKPSSPTPTPSLADLLARDPPPLPSETRYIPPVWLHIGPSNRGFGMLQRSGWNEGEGLGAHVVRLATADDPASSFIKTGDDAVDITSTREVIDLTRSDSEASEDPLEEEDIIEGTGQTQATREISAYNMQKYLLTPLPIVLKADRLGIGLRAKTDGPYRLSRKRVTHNAAALAAHIRTTEEMRKKKTEIGKGTRGFAKIHKREEDKRKAMLAYLND